jgi:putative ABC transport system permease protein
MNNLRIACRQLLKQPGFTAAAVLTLALGIGANITIFTIVNWLFLQPLPVKDPASLVLILQRNSVWSMPYGHSWLDYRDYRDQVETVEDAVATFMNPVHLSAERRGPGWKR